MRRLPAVAVCAAVLCLFALSATSASAAPPEVLRSTFSTVGTESVTLEADLDPGEKETQYHFEYGPADCAANLCTSTPNAKISATSVPPVRVKAQVTGLAPGGVYHFRVVAKNGNTANGPDTTFMTHILPQVFAPCANDAFRGGALSPTDHPSAKLPDCRAYEQASPIAKNGLDARGRVAFVKASVNGDRVSFGTTSGIPGGEGSQELPIYLSSRGGANWSTQGLLPPGNVGEEAFVSGWTPDFSQVFDSARKFSGAGGATLLARSSEGGALETIVPYGSGFSTQTPSYAGSGAGGSVVLFESSSKLVSTPEAIEGKPNLYLWDRETNTVRLAGVLNDETAPPAGAIAGPYDWIGGSASINSGGAANAYYTQDENAISPDGKRVYFTAAKTGQLYMRQNPSKEQSPLDGEGKCTNSELACTLQVSASKKTNGQGPGGTDSAGARPAAFMQASRDGASALFTSSEKLTNDANTGPEVLGAAIARAGIGNGAGKELSFLPASGKGIALDANHIYWANPSAGTIERAKLNGAGNASEVQDEFITGAGNPQYVTVVGEYLYWSDAGDEQTAKGKIGRAKLGAGGAEEVEAGFIEGANDPQGVAVQGEHLYWANAGDAHGNSAAEDATRAIGRAKLGAGGAEEVNQSFIAVGGGIQENRPQGIALDASHIYMGINASQGFVSFVVRYDIDGNPTSEKFIGDGQETKVKGIALDASHVYWARQGANAIGRANLDLSSPELEFISGADHPLGLANDAEHLYWSANQESPGNPGNDLYRWEAGTGKLSDLAPDTGDPNGADVLGVLGTSADNSYVYFAANGDLDGAGPATAGDCKGAVNSGFLSFSGQCSLYLAHEGDPIVFIARLNAGGGTSDAFNWLPHGAVGSQLEKTARVSPDGQTLLFSSQEKLTPYDNEGTAELYRYRVGDPAGIGCVSCDPSGAPPTGTPSLGSINLSTLFPGETSFVLSRNLSADGNRVFFETTDALVGEDTNGVGGCPSIGPEQGKYRVCLDAYEWEAKGTGSCESETQGGGCLYLLSSGKSSDASYFADASASGEDAFLITRSALVGQDQDELYDVYDAHLGGGLAAQNQTPVICEAEAACKGGPKEAPAFETPGTANFNGPVNPKPKKAQHKKHKKKHHNKKHKGKGKKPGREAKATGRAGR